MTEAGTGMTGKGKGKYRTAIILAAVAIGLFVFTIYSGLK